MVGPVSEAERTAFARKLRLAVAVLVGVSAGLTALRVGATPPLAAGAVAVGLFVGWALGRFVVPAGPSPAERQRQRRERVRENPFEGDGTGGSGGTTGDGSGEESPLTTRRGGS